MDIVKPDFDKAVTRIKPFINKTPILTSHYFNNLFNSELFFKCENFQKAGAFKSRGAVNAIFSLTTRDAKNGVATHSSGNHAQALARAAGLRGIPAFIVMPENAPQVKIDAVKDYGGIITFCKPTLEARESTLKTILLKTKAVEIHPYDNDKVIEGQGTAVIELLEKHPNLDVILCPVGGGGLLSGTALAVNRISPETKVIGCEPSQADDAFKSFYSGRFIPSTNPNSIADGLLTSLGKLTFPIIKNYVSEIVTVSENNIVKAMRLIYERMKIVIEPSSAVPVAAILENKINIKGMNVGVILSGGNVDFNKLPWM